MRIVCLSDTHCRHHDLRVPEGDVLVHAGDFCNWGNLEEVASFGRWLRALPYKRKVVIAGNHDWPFERNRREAEAELVGDPRYGVIYLQDSDVEIDGLRFYGSPWQPEFCGWAFNLPRQGYELRQRWAAIPDGVDVLLTHGPAKGILDRGYSERVGCEELAVAVAAKQPRLHVFGHIHPSCGLQRHEYGTSVNASVCNEEYDPVNPIQVIELGERQGQ